jgi:EAL domain-containing protein (putative c-di-GMP-specific phosphodiesterase class I)
MIGEGLDTLEELAMLGELGIHFGQGWLFGHPTPLRPR